jgi:hypothetical protein
MPRAQMVTSVSEIDSFTTISSPTEPLGLTCLNFCRSNAPKWLCFDPYDLDDIVAGRNLERHAETLQDGTYWSDFLPYLNWWIQIAEALSYGRGSGNRWESSDAVLTEFKAKVVAMVGQVLTLYPDAIKTAALGETAEPETEPESRQLEMFKRYRELTICVRDFAPKVWPELNFQWLWEQP